MKLHPGKALFLRRGSSDKLVRETAVVPSARRSQPRRFDLT